MADPLPAHKRAEILVKVVAGIARRHDEIARQISAEAGKPLKAAKVETSRAMSTYTFAAVEARKLAGEVVPMDASQAGEGKLAFTLREPIGIVGAISPFNFPLNLVAHKIAACPRGRLRGRPQAGEPDTALGADARGARARGRVAARLAQRRRRACERDRGRPRRGRAGAGDHVHRLLRRRLEAPRAGREEESAARARKCDPGDRPRRRGPRRGSVQARRERVLVRRPELHLGPADLRPEAGLRRVRRPASFPRSRTSSSATRPRRRPTSAP